MKDDITVDEAKRLTLELSSAIAHMLAEKLPGGFSGQNENATAALLKVASLTLGGAMAAGLMVATNEAEVDTLFRTVFRDVEKTARMTVEKVSEKVEEMRRAAND